VVLFLPVALKIQQTS